MKPCREIENLLYLYGELTDAEKALVGVHLMECEACGRLHESLQTMSTFVERAAQVTIVPQHGGRLTANIMDAVHAKTYKKQSGFSSWLDSVWTKYTLAGTSFALIVLFMIEQQPVPQVNTLSSTTTIQPKTVTLNTTMLLEEVRKNRETNTSSKPSLYACAKSNTCENELIKNYKLKKSS